MLQRLKFADWISNKNEIEITSFELWYRKCSKISNMFLFLFSNKMLVIRAGIHKMPVRIANREDTDPDLNLPCLSRPFLFV